MKILLNYDLIDQYYIVDAEQLKKKLKKFNMENTEAG